MELIDKSCKERNITKKILMIVPLPPPITGQALASEHLFERIKNIYDVKVINYTRSDAVRKSKLSITFINKILKLGKEIKKYAKESDFIYLTISQSLLGNLKDLFFLYKIGRKNRKKIIIHLHGGYFDQFFNKTYFFVRILNKYLFKDVKNGIVLGNSLKRCLLPIISEERIVVIPNFYDEDIHISDSDFEKKWNNVERMNLLFLSNLMVEKGYLDLLEAFIQLPLNIREKFQLSFAGNFENDKDKEMFLKKIMEYNNIKYHGVITGEDKKRILTISHCFILPTYYSIEGQPISILESYASGLIVVTTDQGGIKDVFTDGLNGIEIEKRSPTSIENAILKFINNYSVYKDIAKNNLIYSKEFKELKFIENIINLFN